MLGRTFCLAVLSFASLSCGASQPESQPDDESCTVASLASGQKEIRCPDGTRATIPVQVDPTEESGVAPEHAWSCPTGEVYVAQEVWGEDTYSTGGMYVYDFVEAYYVTCTTWVFSVSNSLEASIDTDTFSLWIHASQPS